MDPLLPVQFSNEPPMRMSRLLVSKEEMAYAGDETLISESVIPFFLRKKVNEGKGKKQ